MCSFTFLATSKILSLQSGRSHARRTAASRWVRPFDCAAFSRRLSIRGRSDLCASAHSRVALISSSLMKSSALRDLGSYMDVLRTGERVGWRAGRVRKANDRQLGSGRSVRCGGSPEGWVPGPGRAGRSTILPTVALLRKASVEVLLKEDAVSFGGRFHPTAATIRAFSASERLCGES